jgi:hypothetical protein
MAGAAVAAGVAQTPLSRQRVEAIAARRRRAREPRRSSGRSRAVIAALALVGVAAVILAVIALSGGSAAHKGAASTSAAHPARAKHAASSHARHSSTASSAAASRARTSVAVLNGTETNGLAHRISGQLQQSGYSRASALGGSPPGANQVTVVEYANGHRGDAEGVARALGVSQAQPVEATVASLAGSASVVVIVGLDKAAAGP